jgi:hypothetical protein
LVTRCGVVFFAVALFWTAVVFFAAAGLRAGVFFVEARCAAPGARTAKKVKRLNEISRIRFILIPAVLTATPLLQRSMAPAGLPYSARILPAESTLPRFF